MGCNVGTFQGAARAKWCETGEEAVEHVAQLNGWNEPGSASYEHFFFYPDDKCPYEEKDEETGEITYRPHCIPMSKVDHDLEDYGGVPEHFRAAIEVKEKEYRVRAEEFRKSQQRAEKERREDRQRKDDERQLEHLQKKLGKQ
jgi:hypothetical protein